MRGRLRLCDAIATLLAMAGVVLAAEAWLADGVFRYVLAGCVAGGLLCVPALSILVWRERARRCWRRTVFALLPLTGLLVVLELLVAVFGPARELPARLRTDARLGHVLEPGSAGTDGNGFRNASAPVRTDVLFVGDSQTWGFQIERAETFTAVFAANTGTSSYQMSNGSYGPVQYRELVRRGLPLQPKLVVIAFYFGNDLIDAVDYAGLEGAEDLRSPGSNYVVRHNPEFGAQQSPNWTMALVDCVLGASRVLDAAARVVKSRLHGGIFDREPGAVLFDGRVPTVLLPAYRLPVVDPDEPNVREGLRISGRCLTDVAAQCRSIGARCLLLAIPTKEYCYQQWQIGRGSPLPALQALHAAETRARSELFPLATAAGCEIADLAPVCVAALQAGTAVWPPSGDGHLNATGHREAAHLIERIWARK